LPDANHPDDKKISFEGWNKDIKLQKFLLLESTVKPDGKTFQFG
jgi:hypothetical protein